MICISVTPESRQLARADLLNASRQCDLVELCLDHLIKEPDIPELLEASKQPVIVSCRRETEGGSWGGTEDERLQLLRQAIVAGPAWIELEIDIANQVPRFGKTKRLISFTRIDRPLTDLEAIYDRAVDCKADAVKFTSPTPTLDAAWPLLAAATKKRDIPVVGIGLGPSGTTFSLLGRKYGAPWIYAALEKGMEAFPGQPTVGDLDEIYRWRDISPRTRFVGVAGFGEAETLTARLLNAGFAAAGVDFRCLPLAIDRMENVAQMLDVLKLPALLPDARLGGQVLSMVKQAEDAVRASQTSDLLLKQENGWHAYNSLWRAALQALEETLGPGNPQPLHQRSVLVIGASPVARALCYAIRQRGGLISVAALDNDRAQLIAQMFEARYVPFANLYDTLCDVVVVTEERQQTARQSHTLNPAYLRENMTVLDVSRPPHDTELLEEARLRGCRIVEPSDVYTRQMRLVFQSLTGRDLPAEAFEALR
jgi:3-dehydroquinate dehydratase/shikimate dehydrogenase